MAHRRDSARSFERAVLVPVHQPPLSSRPDLRPVREEMRIDHLCTVHGVEVSMEAFCLGFVDHIQRPEPPTALQNVVHEVQGPALVWLARPDAAVGKKEPSAMDNDMMGIDVNGTWVKMAACGLSRRSRWDRWVASIPARGWKWITSGCSSGRT